MSREKQTYNTYCIVAYCHWEATGKKLSCEDCPQKNCTQKGGNEDDSRFKQV